MVLVTDRHLAMTRQVVQCMQRTEDNLHECRFGAGSVSAPQDHPAPDSGERSLHVAIPLFAMACGFTAAASFGVSSLAIVALALVPIGMGAAYGPFWSMPTTFLSGRAAAGGIAMIATIVNLSGFLGPTLVGWLKGLSGGHWRSGAKQLHR